MSNLLQVVVILLTLFSCILEFRVLGDKIEQKIYQTLTQVTPCVTLLNATHQIGCKSKRKGNVGVLHVIKSDEDFEWLLHKGEHTPYIPLFTAEYFTDDRFKQLVDADKVAGALVAHNSTPHGPKGFSPEYRCPNDNFGMYKNDYSCNANGSKSVSWNTNGKEMSYRKYDVPVFAIVNKNPTYNETQALEQCYTKHNKPVNGTQPGYPLCGVELKSFMFAAKDTPTCMRKNEAPTFTQGGFCDPLGDYNVWGTLFPMVENFTKDDVILATAKLDSTSFFHDIAPGADNDATGVVCLLAAAEALGRLKRGGNLTAPDLEKNQKHIMFSFFQGEVWDYIGSSRMVYDMVNGNFPCGDEECGLSNVNLKNIAYYLELSQVGLLDEDSLWAHSDPISKYSTGAKVAKMFDVLEGFGSAVNLPIKNSSNETEQPLPPASFQRFLKENPNIPGLVVTDHKKGYTNKFYNSRLDDVHHLDAEEKVVDRLTSLATTVANTLSQLAYNDTRGNITANRTIVSNLYDCFIKNANCTEFRLVLTNNQVKNVANLDKPLNRYVGPFVNQNAGVVTKITERLLASYTGRHIKSTNCKSDKVNYVFGIFTMGNGSTCVNATVYVSPAKSPAFLLKDYTSTSYSTWTESRWGNDFGVRMFLIADPTDEIITLAVGIIITLISLVVTTFMYIKADQLFAPDDSVLFIND